MAAWGRREAKNGRGARVQADGGRQSERVFLSSPSDAVEDFPKGALQTVCVRRSETPTLEMYFPAEFELFPFGVSSFWSFSLSPSLRKST